jgi:hypothetical protein
MRFKKAGASMHNDDESGDALEDVARIHPVVDRLRRLLASATILDLMATADGYWVDREGEGGPGPPSEPPG